jgi:hypothetical protein
MAADIFSMLRMYATTCQISSSLIPTPMLPTAAGIAVPGIPP